MSVFNLVDVCVIDDEGICMEIDVEEYMVFFIVISKLLFDFFGVGLVILLVFCFIDREVGDFWEDKILEGDFCDDLFVLGFNLFKLWDDIKIWFLLDVLYLVCIIFWVEDLDGLFVFDVNKEELCFFFKFGVEVFVELEYIVFLLVLFI